jgi:hypothetical protein
MEKAAAPEQDWEVLSKWGVPWLYCGVELACILVMLCTSRDCACVGEISILPVDTMERCLGNYFAYTNPNMLFYYFNMMVSLNRLEKYIVC